MNYEQTRTSWVQARKDKDMLKIKVLSGIIDKTQKLTKGVNSDKYDDFIVNAVKSEYKGYKDSNEKGIDSKLEISYIETLLPKTLTLEETQELIISYVKETNTSSFSEVMKFLKTKDNINMKEASDIIKNILKV